MIEISVRHQLSSLELDVDIQVDVGLSAVFGRSGCGKTTLINMLAGLMTPDEGRIAVEGKVLFDRSAGINVPPEHRRMGYVFQDARLFPHLRVEQNLVYGMRLLPSALRRHTVNEVADLLDLSALMSRRPATLSGGEKQRVAIGRAILASPSMLLMDEPLASLDNYLKSEIMPFIERLRDEIKLPIFYVSHSIDEVVRLAETVIVMSNGKVEAQGQVESIMSRLDLRPFTGRYEAGAVIAATVKGHDEKYGLTELSCPAGSLFLTESKIRPGTGIRLRIRARDVSLATERPSGTSVLNVFPGTVMEIENGGPRSQVDVLVDIGVPIIARITRRSLAELTIEPGKKVYAMVKAAAIDKPGIGAGERE